VTVMISIARFKMANYAATITYWNLGLAFGMVVVIRRDLKLCRSTQGPHDRALRHLQGVEVPLPFGSCVSRPKSHAGHGITAGQSINAFNQQRRISLVQKRKQQ